MNGSTAEPMTPPEQAQMRILKILEDSPSVSQRVLAEQLGISLGKTNYLLKALLEKGLIKAGNFRRSGSKLGYLYLLTPQGIERKLSLTRAYLARKEAEYEALRAEIAALHIELSAPADSNATGENPIQTP
jgi:EPS-associated MarR family transcriptional regulator